ncbi:hypothetical protein CROQUDRAFT_717735 [Cronartium quercuum f. sp. fusiforme G11]|uniref:Mediator of RNA polymerase II transcription subunit 13 n=1 Tax=Cronartium quercuum f. sp. fusiforme G11 TaxID=708437 RepID=A0A9P6T8A9_9BASI|nr:hypothetical protein CROQUDRAFT_717735 [Cronartium quercuum f. sp. fusiforme G11]
MPLTNHNSLPHHNSGSSSNLNNLHRSSFSQLPVQGSAVCNPPLPAGHLNQNTHYSAGRTIQHSAGRSFFPQHPHSIPQHPFQSQQQHPQQQQQQQQHHQQQPALHHHQSQIHHHHHHPIQHPQHLFLLQQQPQHIHHHHLPPHLQPQSQLHPLHHPHLGLSAIQNHPLLPPPHHLQLHPAYSQPQQSHPQIHPLPPPQARAGSYPSPSQHHGRQQNTSNNSSLPPLVRPAHLPTGYVRPQASSNVTASPKPLPTPRHALPPHNRPNVSALDPRRRSGPQHSPSARLSIASPTTPLAPSNPIPAKPPSATANSQPPTPQASVHPLPAQPSSTTPTAMKPRQASASGPGSVSSIEEQYQLGLSGPQSWGHLTTAAVEVNPWRGWSPCKWKIGLTTAVMPEPGVVEELVTEEMDEIEDRALVGTDTEWKIRWAQLECSESEEEEFIAGLDRRKFSYVLVPGSGLEYWVYEIPGALVPKEPASSRTRSEEGSDESGQAPIKTKDRAVGVQERESLSPKEELLDGLDFQHCKLLAHGALTYSSLFPHINIRSKTTSAKPFVPYLSRPAKNITGNDLLESSHLPVYVYFLQALQRYLLTLALASPQSSPPSAAIPTRWLQWGSDRLLSVPLAPDHALHHALATDSTRLLSAILRSSPALELSLYGTPWLTPYTALCQPSFFSRRLVPVPAESGIPFGFPLVLAPFPSLRARFVRIFGRLNLDIPDPDPGSQRQGQRPEMRLSHLRRYARLEEKHADRLRHLWVSAGATDLSMDDGWLVCRLENDDEEIVWPIGQCLLDLEAWLASSEESSLSDTSADSESLSLPPGPAPASVRVRLPVSRGDIAAKLLRAASGPIDDIAEAAGGYIDWVAQEREVQRKAAAAAGRKEKDESAALALEPGGRGGGHSGSRPPPSDPPLTRPVKRRREELEDGPVERGSCTEPQPNLRVDTAAHTPTNLEVELVPSGSGLADGAFDLFQLPSTTFAPPHPPVSSDPAFVRPFPPPFSSTSNGLQAEGSGSDSSASTVSFTPNNSFEQPPVTPAPSLSLTPGRAHFDTIPTSLFLAPTHPVRMARRPTVDPPGYESVDFGPALTLTDKHYQRRGGKYALPLPPSPCSFLSVSEEGSEELAASSRRLVQDTDPRARLVRAHRLSVHTPHTVATLHPVVTVLDQIPPTPRSWVPLGITSTASSSALSASSDNDEPTLQDEQAVASSSSSESGSDDDESDDGRRRRQKEAAETIVANISKLEACLKRVLAVNNLRTRPPLPAVPTVVPRLIPREDQARISSRTRERLRHWASGLASQAVYDPELERLLESVLPKLKRVDRLPVTETSLAEGQLPRLSGTDVHRPRLDDLRAVSEERAEIETDGRGFVTSRGVRPTSVVLRTNGGNQKLGFPIGAIRHWTKLGLEPVSGRRDVCVSIVLPRVCPTGVTDPEAWMSSIQRWLECISQAYAAAKFGTLSVGKVRWSCYAPAQLAREVEELIEGLNRPRSTRHACFVVVDELEGLRGMMIGAREIRGPDARPVTRLVIGRAALADDRPASVASYALRLYDAMDVLVDRYKAPGLVLDTGTEASPNASQIASSPSSTILMRTRSRSTTSSDSSISEADSNVEEGRVRPGPVVRLLAGHAFFLCGFNKPTQLNLRWPPNGLDVSARHRLLHVAYEIGPEGEWVLVSIVDEMGQQNGLALKFMAQRHRRRQRRARRVGRDEAEEDEGNEVGAEALEIAKVVWKEIAKVLIAAGVEWRVVVSKVGRMEAKEYRAWCELLSRKLPKSELAFHVSLVSLLTEHLPLLRHRTVRPEPSSRRTRAVDSEEGEEVEAEESAGFERMYEREEAAAWIVHESSIRPHTLGTLPGTGCVNSSVVHSLNTSYVYFEGASGGIQVELLGTAATPGSVYQASLFQHREEIAQSLVQLSRLRVARSGSTVGAIAGASKRAEGLSRLLPMHLAGIEIVGKCLRGHWRTLMKMAEDEEMEQ